MSSAAVWLRRVRAEVPSDDAWLGSREAQVLSRLTVAKRREDWRLGRWTAKAALRAYIATVGEEPPDAPRLEVLAAEDGAPEAHVAAERLSLSLSISHSEGEALAVVGAQALRLGCDLEQIAARNPRFADDYFVDAERSWLHALPTERRNEGINLLWSAKEAALKALRVGLTRDTRDLVVAGVDLLASPPPGSGSWQPLEVRDTTGDEQLSGRWALADQTVMTIVSAGAGDLPALERVR